MATSQGSVTTAAITAGRWEVLPLSTFTTSPWDLTSNATVAGVSITKTGAPGALYVVGGLGWHVAHHDRLQVADVHTEFERRRTRQHVHFAGDEVALNYRCFLGVPLRGVLARFEAEERKRLGLDESVHHWVEDMANLTFTKSEKAEITLLIGGLTLAHDYLVEGAFKGIGYNVQMLNVPDQSAFQMGKEFGNRGQCNPTYFTVGGLVAHLIELRDEHGMTDVITAYGMTECVSITNCVPGDPADIIAETCGCAVPGNEVISAGPDGTELPRGESGEIWVRGVTVMQQYWGQPEATAQVLQDGWFRTGDIGYLDDAFVLRVAASHALAAGLKADAAPAVAALAAQRHAGPLRWRVRLHDQPDPRLGHSGLPLLMDLPPGAQVRAAYTLQPAQRGTQPGAERAADGLGRWRLRRLSVAAFGT